MTSSSPLRTEMEKGFLSLEMKTVKSYLELSIVAIAIVNPWEEKNIPKETASNS